MQTYTYILRLFSHLGAQTFPLWLHVSGKTPPKHIRNLPQLLYILEDQCDIIAKSQYISIHISICFTAKYIDYY